MDKSLVSLLQIEGAARDKVDLDGRLAVAGLMTYAMQSGYYQAMVAVVEDYKPAAAMRWVADGVNMCEASVERFRACADRLLAILEAEVAAGTSPIVKALITHDAASCLAKGNGNKPEDQSVLNRAALTTLHIFPLSDESLRHHADWHSVYAKVAVGLYEHGAEPFDETVYRRLIESMERFGSKDAAGRRLFLAKWLKSQGRVTDAFVALWPVMDDQYVSAPNQIAAARAYHEQLMLRMP